MSYCIAFRSFSDITNNKITRVVIILTTLAATDLDKS